MCVCTVQTSSINFPIWASFCPLRWNPNQFTKSLQLPEYINNFLKSNFLRLSWPHEKSGLKTFPQTIQAPHHVCVFICIQYIRFILSLTSAKDNTFIGDLVSGLQARAVPAVSSELMLALMDGNLDALYGRGRHIWMSHTHVQLFLGETGQSQTHRVGVQNRVKGDL